MCMGVPARIVIYGPDKNAATEAAAAAFARLAELDSIMSDYRRDSDLNHLCERGVGAGTPVREELYDILRLSERVSLESDGMFDVSVGPAVALWRRARQTGALPAPDEVAAARRLMGWQMIKLEEGRRVRLLKEGMKLDLGGIAKGYAAERAVRVLRDRGFRRVMVGLAGGHRGGGPPAETRRVADRGGGGAGEGPGGGGEKAGAAAEERGCVDERGRRAVRGGGGEAVFAHRGPEDGGWG